MKKQLVVVALVVPMVLGAASCAGAPKGKAKGTFPYCSYQPVEDGVLVPEENHAPCVVDDTREADDRSGYSGGHVIIVPQGTSKARTPLPSTTAKAPAQAAPTKKKA